MGYLEEAFTLSLLGLMEADGLQPHTIPGPARRVYFGDDRMRDWLQVDFWALLKAHPRSPTILAEIDSSPADLEHNVGKYLWWSATRPPFWQPPTLLVSAYTENLPKNYLLHETIARFLGERLCAVAPDMHHTLVTLRAESKPKDAAQRLAELAFAEVRQWLDRL